MRRLASILVAAAIILGASVALIWGFVESRDELAAEARRERALKAPLRVSHANGTATVKIDPATQRLNGIETAMLTAAPYREQVRAYGMVLDLRALTDLSNRYLNAKSQLESARAKLAASKPAFERARDLYEHGHALSQAGFEAAEAAFHTDEAAVAAAAAQVRTLTANAYQDWGTVLGKSLVDGTAMVTRLIEREDSLLQVTLPPGASVAQPPATAWMERDKDARTAITFVSSATRTDPKIQGISFFYVAGSASDALPGLNVLVMLPTGTVVEGVAVPAAAIVWWQDRAWVYRRVAADAFERVEIATGLPAPGGGYIVTSLAKDTAIVVRGAQLLLSEEFRAQIQVGGD